MRLSFFVAKVLKKFVRRDIPVTSHAHQTRTHTHVYISTMQTCTCTHHHSRVTMFHLRNNQSSVFLRFVLFAFACSFSLSPRPDSRDTYGHATRRWCFDIPGSVIPFGSDGIAGYPTAVMSRSSGEMRFAAARTQK